MVASYATFFYSIASVIWLISKKMMMFTPLRKKFTNLSLESEYLAFCLVIVITLVTFSAFFYCYFYSLYVNEKNEKLANVAQTLQQEVDSLFGEGRDLLKSIGTQIALQPKDFHLNLNIMRLMKEIGGNFKNLKINYFSWVQPDGKVIMNNKAIVKDSFPDISRNAYFRAATKQPWVLKVAAPTQSILNNEFILPLAMSIEDPHGKYLGYLLLGLEMAAINAHLKKISEMNDVDFTLVDEKCSVIFSSSNAQFYKSDICTTLVTKNVRDNNGFLSQPFVLETINYTYYKKLQNVSNVIFTGYDKHVFERKLHQQIFPKLYEFIFMGLLCTIMLYFFRKKIIVPITTLSRCAFLISEGKTDIEIPKQTSTEMFNLAKALILVKHYIRRKESYRKKLEVANEIVRTSAEAREDFFKSIDQELMYPLKEILIYAEILLKDVMEHDHPDATQRAVKCIDKIREAVVNIRTKTSNSLNLSYFNLNDVIKQAYQVNLKHSFLKNIIINLHLGEELPSMYGDILKLKQILVGLIFQSIENSPERQKVIVSTSAFSKDDHTYLKVIIKDKSFGLSEEELQRIQENVGWHNENYLFSNIEYQFVEKFVKMHQGSFCVENKIHKGRTAVLTFPLLTEKDFAINKEKEKDNVYYLSPKNS